jgi:GNAT superfamily N-acetyltransferase
VKDNKDLKIRPVFPDEETWFFEEERKTMYPLLEKKVLSRWFEAGYHISFVLLLGGRKIGGVSFDIYDFLKKGEDNYIILDTWNFFIAPEWQKKSCGKYLLRKIIPEIKDYYLREYGFKVAQVIIETNTAPVFYEKVVPCLGYPFSRTEMTVAGERVVYFFVNVE